MEDWVTIKNIKKRRPDMGSRQIAEILGISRNTVKKALRSDKTPKYERKQKINPEILPFKDYILECITVKKFKKSRILNEIISKGYKGSESAFYRYCDKIKEPETRTFLPYETAPGVQAQFDWSPYVITLKGKLTKIYVYSYIFGFSRYILFGASLTQNMSSVFEAIENSMIESGGVCEKLQTDNAKCFVNNASVHNFQWNERYLALCGHYGFKPTRSLPGHPWSKGKVERPFNYLEEHFIKGNEFEDFEDFILKLKDFQIHVNERVHSTTKQKPVDLFEKEKDTLAELPLNRYVNIKEEVRKTTADCLISYAGSRYSVPYLFATKEVWIKVSQGYYLEIYSAQNKLIAKHKMSTEKGAVVMNTEHYKNHSIERGNWLRLKETFLSMFHEYEWFIEKVKTQKRINPNYHLTKIIELARYYKKQDLKNAFNSCCQYNCYTAIFIKGYLENNASPFDIEPKPIIKLKLVRTENTDIKRSLNYYQQKEIE